MKIEFWGTRGASATPDTDKLRFGGNTCCAVIHSQKMPHHFFILDAGTGLARFGSTLSLNNSYSATLLLCHSHLYHIIGFQFSPFAYSTLCRTLVVGPSTRNFALETVFDHIMASSYSPVYGLENLMAKVRFQEVTDITPLVIGEMTITALPFVHNQDSASWGYRLDNQRHSLVYITDALLRRKNGQLDPFALKLVQGADVLVAGAFDPHYERQDSTCYGDVLELAHRCGVKMIFFTHHHPDATDAHLERLQNELSHQYQDLDIILAREGMFINL